MRTKIAVIGAGVIGLTSAIRLLEQQFDVTIFARDITENMASRAAPAIWLPYKAFPEELVFKWARQSLEVYQSIDTASGVELLDYVGFYNEDHYPAWTTIIKNFKEIPTDQLPSGSLRGLTTQLYRIDTSIYVDYLQQWFEKLGGKFFQTEFKSIHSVDKNYKLIINCSGVWSHFLVPDNETFPIRGQFLITDKPPGLNTIKFVDVDDDSYILILPRTNDCYLGGTTINHDWNTAVDPKTSETILRRAKELEPLLKNVTVKRAGVGLRPGRNSIRLQAEALADGRTVIHNYGHGGAGFTVGWGCADEIVKLALLHTDNPPTLKKGN